MDSQDRQQWPFKASPQLENYVIQPQYSRSTVAPWLGPKLQIEARELQLPHRETLRLVFTFARMPIRFTWIFRLLGRAVGLHLRSSESAFSFRGCMLHPGTRRLCGCSQIVVRFPTSTQHHLTEFVSVVVYRAAVVAAQVGSFV